jgi:hypothetical protein
VPSAADTCVQAALSLRLRLHSGLRERGRRLRRRLVGPTEVGPFRFEEALLGVVGLAFCEPMSQRRDMGHPAGVVGDQKKAILSLRLRLRSGLRQSGRRLRRRLVGPTEVGPFQFEEALLGVVGLAFCEPVSQRRDATPASKSACRGPRTPPQQAKALAGDPGCGAPGGRRLRRGFIGPTEVGPFRFEEALLGVVGLAFCEPMSQRRDMGHPANPCLRGETPPQQAKVLAGDPGRHPSKQKRLPGTPDATPASKSACRGPRTPPQQAKALAGDPGCGAPGDAGLLARLKSGPSGLRRPC